MKEGLQASDLVEKAIKYIDKKGDVMDLGCGAGENAVYLAFALSKPMKLQVPCQL